MNNKKATTLLILGTVIIAFIAIYFWSNREITNQPNTNNSNVNALADTESILFYSDTCPHCTNVEKYVSENKVAERFNFKSLEVGKDEDNANLLIARAAKCGLDANNIGVPFLWSDGQCFMGDIDVINFLKNK